MKAYASSFVSFFALVGLVVAPVFAQPEKIGASPRAGADFEYGSVSERLSADFLLFFAIAGEKLANEDNTVAVTVYDDRGTLAVESFSIGKLGEPLLVLEAFSQNPQIRAAVHKSASEGQRVDVEISVNGEVFQRAGYDELNNVSAEALSFGLLPRALPSKAVGPDGVDPNGGPFSLIPICGNGECENGPFDFPPENSFNCPEDCGGPWLFCGDGTCTAPENCENCEVDCGPCPGCPTDLGNFLVETPLFALGVTGSDCWLDHEQPNQQVIYLSRSTIGRRMTVNRVLECDGSITETVIPGTTIFICLDCWQRTDEQCNGPMDWTPPCTL